MSFAHREQNERGLLGRVFDLCRMADVQGLLLCLEDRETLEIIADRIETNQPTAKTVKELYDMLVRITPRLIGTPLERDLLTLKAELWVLRGTTVIPD